MQATGVLHFAGDGLSPHAGRHSSPTEHWDAPEEAAAAAG